MTAPIPTPPDDVDETPEGDDSNLTAKTFAGVRWTYLSTVIGAVLQLGFAAIVSRLLPEEAFGLLAVAQFTLRFSAHFAQMGVSQALINKKRLSSTDVRAGFTSGLALGTAFVALIYAIAPLTPRLFSEVGAQQGDTLVLVVRVMGATLLLSGLSMTAQALMQRSLRFKELAIIDIGSYLLGYYVIGLTVAFTSGGVEALVAANVSQWALLVVGLYARTRHSLKPTFRPSAFKGLYGYGARISFTGIMEFLGENLDTASVARYQGAAAAGAYNRAYTLVSLPLYYATNSLNEVLFPGFSRMQGQSDRMQRTYRSASRFAATFLLPTCAGIAVASDQIVNVVLGPDWERVIQVLPIIATATAFHFLSNLSSVVMNATARLNEKMALEAVYLVLLGGMMWMAIGHGTAAFAVALAIGEFVRHLGFLVLMRRVLHVPVRAHVVWYWRPAAVAALTAGTIAAIRWGLYVIAGLPSILVLPVEMLGGLATVVLNLRVGLLRPVSADLRERLGQAGSLDVPTSRVARLSGYLLGSDGTGRAR